MSLLKKAIMSALPGALREAVAHVSRQREQERERKRLSESNRRKIESLLAGSVPVQLELGAGENRGIPGWTYADINEHCDLTLDLSEPLPFPEDSVAAIYSSHLLEHFKYRELLAFLQECRRILKPGGVFSAALPNARIFLEAYSSPEGFDPTVFCRYTPAYNYLSQIDYVNYIAYMDGHHNYMFDEENAVRVLEASGFSNARLRDFDKRIDLKERDVQSIYVVAEKEGPVEMGLEAPC